MWKQRIRAGFPLRRLEIVLSLAVFLLDGVIELHSQRPVGIVAGRKSVSPNQIIDSIGQRRYGDQNEHQGQCDFLHRVNRIHCRVFTARFCSLAI